MKGKFVRLMIIALVACLQFRIEAVAGIANKADATGASMQQEDVVISRLMYQDEQGTLSGGKYLCPDRQHMLDAVEAFRAKHGLPQARLTWNTTLARTAVNSVTCGMDLTHDAPGLGYSSPASSVRILRFKCISAVLHWYLTAQKLQDSSPVEPSITDNENESSSTTAAVKVLHSLLWNETTQLGCGLVSCQENTTYSVVCVFDQPAKSLPSTGDLLEEEIANILEQQGILAPPRTCPFVHNITEDETITTVAAKYKTSVAEVFCYFHQYDVSAIGQEGVLVAIPCSNDSVDVISGSCSQYDLFRGINQTEGHCPSTHVVQPSKPTFDDVADTYAEVMGLRSFLGNITSSDLCCYNPDYDCGSPLDPLHEFYSRLAIPCVEHMQERSCKQQQQPSVQLCPDALSFITLLNIFRSHYRLPDVSWDPDLANRAFSEMRNHMRKTNNSFCRNDEYSAASNYNGVIMEHRTFGSTTSNQCTPFATYWVGVLVRLSEWLSLGPDSSVSSSSYARQAAALISNSTRNIGCTLVACGAFDATIICYLDASSNKIYRSALRNLPEPAGTCPSFHFFLEGDTLDSLENQYNVTVDEILCFNHETKRDSLEFRNWWNYLQPIAIPCSGALSQQQMEECYAELKNECGRRYAVQVGEHVTAVANRFNVSAQDVCCYNNLTSNCSVRTGVNITIPCPGDTANSDCDNIEVCRVPHIVVDGEGPGSIADGNGVTREELCCYWGMPQDRCSTKGGEVVFIPCAMELMEAGCRERASSPAPNATATSTPVASEGNASSGGSSAAMTIGVAVGSALGALVLLLMLLSGFVLWKRMQPRKTTVTAKEAFRAVADKPSPESPGRHELESWYLEFLNSTTVEGPNTPTRAVSKSTSKKSGSSHSAASNANPDGLDPTSNYVWSSNDPSSSIHSEKSRDFVNTGAKSVSNITRDYVERGTMCSTGEGWSQADGGAMAMPITSTSTVASGSGTTTASPGSQASAVDVKSWIIPGDEIIFTLGPDGKPLQVGEGGFSKVYKGSYKGETIAVKLVGDTAQSEADVKALLREAAFYRKCDHSNIVRYLGSSFCGGGILMVLEFMESGDLFSLLHGRRGSDYLWNQRGKFIALDIAAGLQYLHSLKIVHSDLKSPNVMLDGNGVAKIGDMGMSKFLVHTYVTQKGQIGTYAWAAPEAIVNSKITEKADLYSLGVVLWEIVTGELPQRGALRPIRVPDECPAAVSDLIRHCLMSNNEQRPSAAEVYQRLSRVVTENGQ